VRRLAWTERDAAVEEESNTFGRGRHVRALDHRAAAVLHERRGVATVELVLRRAGQRSVAGQLPDVATRQEPRASSAPLCILVDASALDVLHLLEQREIDAAR